MSKFVRGGGIMAEDQPGIDRSKSIEDLHHLRLMALLDEQVRDKGVRKAAEDLGVDHRTLASSLDSGKADPADAGGPGPGACWRGRGRRPGNRRSATTNLAGRLDVVEEKVEEQGREITKGLSAVQERGQAAQDGTGAVGAAHRGTAGPGGRWGRCCGSNEYGGSTRHAPAGGRRPSPGGTFLTWWPLIPASDDESVFGKPPGRWSRNGGNSRTRIPDRGQGTGVAAGGRTVSHGGTGACWRNMASPCRRRPIL